MTHSFSLALMLHRIAPFACGSQHPVASSSPRFASAKQSFATGSSGLIADVASGSALCDVPHVTQQPWLKRTAAQSAATTTRPLCSEVTGAPKYGAPVSGTSYL